MSGTGKRQLWNLVPADVGVAGAGCPARERGNIMDETPQLSSLDDVRRMRILLCTILYLHDIAPAAVCERLGMTEEAFAEVLRHGADLRTSHIEAVLDLAGITHAAFYNTVFQICPPGQASREVVVGGRGSTPDNN